MDRSIFQRLARVRLMDAKALLKQGHYDGAPIVRAAHRFEAPSQEGFRPLSGRIDDRSFSEVYPYKVG